MMDKEFEKIDLTYPEHVYESRKKEKNKKDMKFLLGSFIFLLILFSIIGISEYKKYSYLDSYGHIYLSDYIEDKIYLNSPDYILFSKSSDEWSFMKEDKSYEGLENISFVPFNNFEACINMLLSKGVKQYGISCVNKNTGEEFSLIKDINKLNSIKEKVFLIKSI